MHWLVRTGVSRASEGVELGSWALLTALTGGGVQIRVMRSTSMVWTISRWVNSQALFSEVIHFVRVC